MDHMAAAITLSELEALEAQAVGQAEAPEVLAAAVAPEDRAEADLAEEVSDSSLAMATWTIGTLTAKCQRTSCHGMENGKPTSASGI